MASMPAYDLEAVTKWYARASAPANDRITLSLRRGEILGLIGANGAGKSTLVKQMMNLIRPSSGRVLIDGHPVQADATLVPRTVSYLPQKTYAFDNLTVRQAVYYTARLRGLRAPDARRRCDRLLEEWELGSCSRRLVVSLSGGQQRLVGLAAALIGDLPILILDEPTNELDPVYRRRVWQKLREANRERGATIVLVTHNLHEAEDVVDRVAVLHAGRLVAVDRPADLIRRFNGHVTLDLAVRPEVQQAVRPIIERIGTIQLEDDSRYRVRLAEAEVPIALQRLLKELPIHDIVDFRLGYASLEDVFSAMETHHEHR